MNRVRRVSRKYAELYNRPDHIARTQARIESAKKRASFLQRQSDAMTLMDNNPPKPRVVDKPRKNGKTMRMLAKPFKFFQRRGQR